MTDGSTGLGLEIKAVEPKPVEAEPAGLEPPSEHKPSKTPECVPSDLYAEVTALLQQIRQARKRSLFALVSGSIDQETLEEVYSWKKELKKAGLDGQMDVLIDSPGGALTSCYMIARLLSRSTNSWEALVPTYAASGATLICLGSCNIVMSEIAQLGPIDPQVLSKRQQKFFASERQSPLEAFQAVKYLREFALASMDAGMKFLLNRGVAAQRALETASMLAAKLVEPIVEKIEPYDLGAFRPRQHHGGRVLSKNSGPPGWQQENPKERRIQVSGGTLPSSRVCDRQCRGKAVRIRCLRAEPGS